MVDVAIDSNLDPLLTFVEGLKEDKAALFLLLNLN
jgi:hypothetical protein